jgi:hypothetical protein
MLRKNGGRKKKEGHEDITIADIFKGAVQQFRSKIIGCRK